MTEFLLFVGPYKTLFYGFAVGFVLGVMLCMWTDARTEAKP